MSANDAVVHAARADQNRVLAALLAGYRDSWEISELTGLSEDDVALSLYRLDDHPEVSVANDDGRTVWVNVHLDDRQAAIATATLANLTEGELRDLFGGNEDSATQTQLRGLIGNATAPTVGPPAMRTTAKPAKAVRRPNVRTRTRERRSAPARRRTCSTSAAGDDGPPGEPDPAGGVSRHPILPRCRARRHTTLPSGSPLVTPPPSGSAAGRPLPGADLPAPGSSVTKAVAA